MTDKEMICKCDDKDCEQCSFEKQLRAKEQECFELQKTANAYNYLVKLANYRLDKIEELQQQLKAKEQECEMLKKQYNCYACDTCTGKEDYINLKRHCESAIKSLHNKLAELDQLKAENEELKKTNIHIDNNRIVKAEKLKRIEDLIIACNSGYTDEFTQELLVILHEPEPIKE